MCVCKNVFFYFLFFVVVFNINGINENLYKYLLYYLFFVFKMIMISIFNFSLINWNGWMNKIKNINSKKNSLSQVRAQLSFVFVVVQHIQFLSTFIIYGNYNVESREKKRDECLPAIITRIHNTNNNNFNKPSKNLPLFVFLFFDRLFCFLPYTEISPLNWILSILAIVFYNIL